MLDKIRKKDILIINKILKKYTYSESNLIPILQSIQSEYGYVPRTLVDYIGKEMKLYPSRIYGILTFYSQFSLKPRGKNIIRVCKGTACHVKGCDAISTKLNELLELSDGDTTKDNKFTVEHVACIGACARAPLIVVNKDVYGKVDEESVGKIISKY